MLDSACPRQHVWDGLRAASELLEDLARQTGGLVWDGKKSGPKHSYHYC